MVFKPFLITLLVGAISLSACASAPKPDNRPSAADVPMSHYSGTWLEIGRRPMWLTDGCVAGYTTYSPGNAPGEILIEDGCHEDTPTGKLKTIRARGTLLDPGAGNTRLKARYPFFITIEYDVLYEAPDHSWFISANPSMHDLWIYARAAPSKAARDEMVAKAKSLGYDVNLLEFPAQ